MSADFILETEGLTKSFGGFTAVQGVDLRVREGTIHALIGPNGAGKTTVFSLLSKFLAPTAGSIRYQGRDITRLPAARIAQMGMIRSFQISAVFSQMSVLENVRVALQRPHGGTFRFWRSDRTLEVLDEQALEVLASVGLADWAGVRAAELPYGRKRALEIATTLALSPRIMLLDEPMAGMGTEDVDQVSKLIKRVAADRTVLMVEHNLNVVAEISDTITVLQRGEVLVEGSYAEVSANPEVMSAYMGTADAQ